MIADDDDNDDNMEPEVTIQLNEGEEVARDEADVEESKENMEALTIEDFRYCMHRSPDFKDVFSFKI